MNGFRLSFSVGRKNANDWVKRVSLIHKSSHISKRQPYSKNRVQQQVPVGGARFLTLRYRSIGDGGTPPGDGCALIRKSRRILEMAAPIE